MLNCPNLFHFTTPLIFEHYESRSSSLYNFLCSPSHPPPYDPICPTALPSCVLPWSNPPPPFQVTTRTTHVPVVTKTYAPHTPNTTLITLFLFICQRTKKQQSTLSLDNKHTHTFNQDSPLDPSFLLSTNHTYNHCYVKVPSCGSAYYINITLITNTQNIKMFPNSVSLLYTVLQDTLPHAAH